ncbi:alpha-L-rhamnosidase N-terminal domain-containing protein, partial [Candidatus Sumerlaeota bacterium]|nr:alpha-L-rhamnosidase N-terminal domain-containing protein [Candidatus Sumerlaeota bacterium]
MIMNRSRLTGFTFFLFLFHIAFFPGAIISDEKPEIDVVNLTCEYRANPFGMDNPNPSLSWRISYQRRGEKQTAYHIIVAGNEESIKSGKGDMWDTGRIPSGRSLHVIYKGKPLCSGEKYWWAARVWDKNGQPSPWSAPASFTTGLFSESDWHGNWIAPKTGAPQLIGPVLGYHAQISDQKDEIKWAQIDLGQSLPIHEARLHPVFHEDIPGFGFPMRFRLDISDDAAFTSFTTVANQADSDFPNPGKAYASFPIDNISARYIRITSFLMWQRPHGDHKYCFALAEIEAFSDGSLISRNAPVSSSDSFEGCGWAAIKLTDGYGLLSDEEDLNRIEEEKRKEAEALLQGYTPEDPQHAAILMRREIEIEKKVRRATVFFSGLGWSELFIDGNKISDDVISPVFSSYNKSVNYVAYDVTSGLPPGRRAIGVILGNGWLNTPSPGYLNIYTNKSWTSYPKLLLELVVEYADGSKTNFVSDENWKWSVGEITMNDGWYGENVDNRLAKPGWDRAGYNDEKWKPVVMAPSPGGKLMAQMVPPIRICETILPTGVEKVGDAWIFTLPFISSGIPVLKTIGEKGRTISISWGNENKGTFILHGEEEEIYQPKFIYETIHQISVSGLEHEPDKDTLTVKEIHTDLADVGSFECSDPWFNELHEVLRRTQKNYNYGFPQDPTREKCGWTQDVQSMLESAIYYFDMAAVYGNWFKDFREAQREDGYVPCCAPGDFEYPTLNGPFWGGVIVWGPWHHYLYYGDKRILEENYDAMKGFVDYMTSRAGESRILNWGLGDWNCPGAKAPIEMTSTAAYAFYARILSETAKILKKENDIVPYAKLSEQIKEAFNKKWLDPKTGIYQGNHQTVQALAWSLDLAPKECRDLVLQRLLDDIASRNHHLDTGFIGTPYLVKTLVESGNAHVMAKIARAKDFPGWNALMRGGVFMEDWRGGGV